MIESCTQLLLPAKSRRGVEEEREIYKGGRDLKIEVVREKR